MPLTATAAVALGAGLDRLFAEPPTRLHPVVWFGKLVAPFDREWDSPKLVGLAVALALPLLAAGVVAGVVASAGLVHPVAAAAVAGLVLFATTSLRMLLDAAGDVVALTESDLDDARFELRALAGRDASTLDAAEIRSAAVESLAENLADGLVAPLLGFALFAPLSLPLAAAAAAWVKAVNTLDSMLGYRSKPVGWAPARLDDAAMWLPARVSALLIALAAGAPAAVVRARDDARVPASPNSGWPMATLAVVLGTRLEKSGHYRLNADGDLPTVADAERGVRVVAVAGLLAVAVAGVVAWF
ncbi:adenosylcobinamide-phosphate synthase [Halogranum gelatinilyticum]|uniref:Probable cobalamin biosynthesis protein CobD n=1 Tax=Halogranum gelatinilyticum TaxID=660521 RepID=A0A1G9Q748_9EURY|nr:adenosylcobinamide-phosphate synthase CbiB [Halogranum gelatinilyticum]SDM06760.1 adenosylcobinamide-phosphate synthase [Halogranum gelatinilyticum]